MDKASVTDMYHFCAISRKQYIIKELGYEWFEHNFLALKANSLDVTNRFPCHLLFYLELGSPSVE